MLYYYNKCPICGKMFYVSDRSSWVYCLRIMRRVAIRKKVKDSNREYARTEYYCSWSCYRKAQVKYKNDKEFSCLLRSDT